MKVYGDAAIARFSRKHAASRKPLQRFLEVARAADWPHFPAVKLTFGGADYASSSGTLIFDVGGNKYRIVALVDFKEQMLFIQDVMTHEEYDREEL